MAEYIEREALRNALYEADAITMEGVKILNQFPASDVEQAWISVNERLPEKPGYYLAYWHGHSCPEGRVDVLNFDGTVFPWTTLWKAVKNEVTHWMPLPAQPVED